MSKYNYDFPMFSLSADVIIYNSVTNEVFLIERGKDPYKNKYALPGGFVNIDETTKEAAIREAYEETGIVINPFNLNFLCFKDAVNRDTRNRVVTFVYYYDVANTDDINKLVAGDDAINHKVVKFNQVNDIKLAFDHNDILLQFLNRV